MAAHSSILAWRIPWTEEPGGLQSMGSQRVRHNLATKQQPHNRKFYYWCEEDKRLREQLRKPSLGQYKNPELF